MIEKNWKVKLGGKLFKRRSYLPLPYFIILVIFAKPTLLSIIIGFIIMVLGENFRIWGVSAMGKFRGDYPVMEGPFAYVRNPLYVGNILLYAGAGIMSLSLFPWLQIAGVLWFYVQYRIIIRWEEDYFEGKYKGDFLNYCKNVPPFFPRIKAYRNKRENLLKKPMTLKEIFRNERSPLLGFSSIVIYILFKYFLKF
jgi:protein-S-isoprenylcysteine O-methyltransferase Ste14